jgi:hypothetical protein
MGASCRTLDEVPVGSSRSIRAATSIATKARSFTHADAHLLLLLSGASYADPTVGESAPVDCSPTMSWPRVRSPFEFGQYRVAADEQFLGGGPFEGHTSWSARNQHVSREGGGPDA